MTNISFQFLMFYNFLSNHSRNVFASISQSLVSKLAHPAFGFRLVGGGVSNICFVFMNCTTLTAAFSYAYLDWVHGIKPG